MQIQYQIVFDGLGQEDVSTFTSIVDTSDHYYTLWAVPTLEEANVLVDLLIQAGKKELRTAFPEGDLSDFDYETEQIAGSSIDYKFKPLSADWTYIIKPLLTVTTADVEKPDFLSKLIDKECSTNIQIYKKCKIKDQH